MWYYVSTFFNFRAPGNTMLKIVVVATLTSVALVASNFVYQASTGMNWGVAIERSYFQLLAIVIFTAGLAAVRKK
jgi:hypothetical protein